MVRGEECFAVGDGVQPDVGCNVDSGIAEVGTREIGTSHLAAFYFCIAQIGIAQVGASKVAESYVGIREVGTFKVGIAQVQLVEECRAEVVGAALFLTKPGDYFALNVIYLNHKKSGLFFLLFSCRLWFRLRRFAFLNSFFCNGFWHWGCRKFFCSKSF